MFFVLLTLAIKCDIVLYNRKIGGNIMESFIAFSLAIIVAVGGIFLVIKMFNCLKSAQGELHDKTLQYRKQAEGKPFCPNCGCTDLSANNRGFSMVTGTIGSKDVYVTCIKCGHRWKAGQYNYLYKD